MCSSGSRSGGPDISTEPSTAPETGSLTATPKECTPATTRARLSPNEQAVDSRSIARMPLIRSLPKDFSSAKLAAVLAAARQRSRREDDVAQAIRDGGHLWDLIGAEAAYRALGPEEIDAAWKP